MQRPWVAVALARLSIINLAVHGAVFLPYPAFNVDLIVGQGQFYHPDSSLHPFGRSVAPITTFSALEKLHPQVLAMIVVVMVMPTKNSFIVIVVIYLLFSVK